MIDISGGLAKLRPDLAFGRDSPLGGVCSLGKDGIIGSYALLYIGPVYVGGDKNDVNPLTMTLFRESEKQVRRVSCASDEGAQYVEAEPEDLSDLEVVKYVAPAHVVRDRLELMGFTVPTALAAFEHAVCAERARHAEVVESIREQLGPNFVDHDGAALAQLTAAQWMENLKSIREAGLSRTYKEDPSLAHVPPLIRYMLSHPDLWQGFPSEEIRHAIRLALEVLPNEDVVYDITDLVPHVVESSEDLVAYADELLTEDVARTRRVVILTEGSTDRWIIERSLKLLIPHLADYFRFMDFDGARVAGGAGALAAIVKAFVGAGISNRIVALFDNDTAASSAIRGLAQVQIPKNIKVLQYPPLAIARDYPTLGPTGVANMDVNGLSGSIELYVGRDVLERDGTLLPVQWKGFDEGLRQYQGEVGSKRVIHERFEAKLRAAEADSSRILSQDWSGMHLILDQIRTAFHEDDAAELIANESPHDGDDAV